MAKYTSMDYEHYEDEVWEEKIQRKIKPKRKKKSYDEIKINGTKNIKPFNYNIPSDISSSSFFIILTALTKNSKLKLKNVNINPTRVGILKILKKMVYILGYSL